MPKSRNIPPSGRGPGPQRGGRPEAGLQKGTRGGGLKGPARKAKTATREHLARGLNREQYLELNCIVCPRGSRRNIVLNKQRIRGLQNRRAEQGSRPSAEPAMPLPIVPFVPQEGGGLFSGLQSGQLAQVNDTFDEAWGGGGGFDADFDVPEAEPFEGPVDPSALVVVTAEGQQIQQHVLSLKDLLLYFRDNQAALLQSPEQVNAIYTRLCELMDANPVHVIELINLYASDQVDAEFRGIIDSMLTAYFQGEQRDVMPFLRQTIETKPVEWFLHNQVGLFVSLEIGQADVLRESLYSHDLAPTPELKLQALQWFRVFSGGDEQFCDNLVKGFFNASNDQQLPVELREPFANLPLRMAYNAFILSGDTDLHTTLFGRFETLLNELTDPAQVTTVTNMLLSVAQAAGKDSVIGLRALEIVSNYAASIKGSSPEFAAGIEQNLNSVRTQQVGTASILSGYLWSGLKVGAGIALLLLIARFAPALAPVGTVPFRYNFFG